MSEKTILLVEDNPDDELLTIIALRASEVSNEIVVARDGAEALDYLFGTGVHAGRDPDDLPQIVLMDLKLPKIDGLEVLRRLRADPRTALLPVVMLTGSNYERDVSNAYRFGANSYVQKPVNYVAFADTARELGLRALLAEPTLSPPASSPPRAGV